MEPSKFGMSEWMALIAFAATIISLLVAVIALIYSLRKSDDFKRIEKEFENLRTFTNHLEKRLNGEIYVIDAVARALHALNQISVINSPQLIAAIKNKDVLREAERVAKADLDVTLDVLGLFSEDKERRISAQRSLAYGDGDLYTLQIFRKIDRGELGVRDDDIKEATKALEFRLKERQPKRPWGGRPSGGNF